MVYVDENGNNQKESSERALGGVSVKLRGSVGGQTIQRIGTTLADGAMKSFELLDGFSGVRFAEVALSSDQRSLQLTIVTDSLADYILGSSPGVPAQYMVLNAATNQQVRAAYPFGSSFTGGVAVAVGDVNNDGVLDVIAGQASGGSLVRVFNGRTGSDLLSFTAIEGFTGGVTVAAGDVNGDGRVDIVVGTAVGTPTVKVFRGLDGVLLHSFSPFPLAAGVHVSAGDLNGDGRAEIVVGMGTGAPSSDPSRVAVFDGRDLQRLTDFVPFPNFTGGARVAVDARSFSIIVGMGPGGSAIKTFLDDGTLLAESSPFPNSTAGVQVAVMNTSPPVRVPAPTISTLTPLWTRSIFLIWGTVLTCSASRRLTRERCPSRFQRTP